MLVLTTLGRAILKMSLKKLQQKVFLHKWDPKDMNWLMSNSCPKIFHLLLHNAAAFVEYAANPENNNFAHGKLIKQKNISKGHVYWCAMHQ